MCVLLGFLFFWGIVFLVTTSLVALLKHENQGVEETSHGIVETYQQLYHIVRLPAVISLIVIMLTCKVRTIDNDIRVTNSTAIDDPSHDIDTVWSVS